MTVNELYKYSVDILNRNEIDDSEFDSRIIIQNVLGFNHSDFLFNRNLKIDSADEKRIIDFIDQRVKGRPLQYLIGEWDFMDLTFKVGDGVLIPRPETEEICRYTIDKIKNREKVVVFDLCSGSGCIGLTIKHYVSQAEVYLVEFSDDALIYLNKNREALGFARSVPVIKGDVLGGFEKFAFLPTPDVIISNPPYIKSDEINELQKEVLNEPRMALDGGTDGYDFYRCFAEKWMDNINEGGFFAVECGEEQARKISELFSDHSSKTEIITDFNNIERFVVAYR